MESGETPQWRAHLLVTTCSQQDYLQWNQITVRAHIIIPHHYFVLIIFLHTVHCIEEECLNIIKRWYLYLFGYDNNKDLKVSFLVTRITFHQPCTSICISCSVAVIPGFSMTQASGTSTVFSSGYLTTHTLWTEGCLNITASISAGATYPVKMYYYHTFEEFEPDITKLAQCQECDKLYITLSDKKHFWKNLKIITCFCPKMSKKHEIYFWCQCAIFCISKQAFNMHRKK